MDDWEELCRHIAEDRPVSWEEFPDLALYMDQVISYMPRQLTQFREGESLTSAMVNNYIKDGLLPRADGKRYRAEHLAYLTAICAMKRVLTVKDVKALLAATDPDRNPKEFYERFCSALDEALSETAQRMRGAENSEAELADLALKLALRSYADQLACTRVLDLLRKNAPEQEEPKKSKGK